MAILRVKDVDGNVMAIPTVKGDKGDKGDRGAGVHSGSYKGVIDVAGSQITQYVDLGSPHVKTVLLYAPNAPQMLLLVTADGVSVEGEQVANLISGKQMFAGDNMFLAVHAWSTNARDITYHYLAFVEEAAE